MSRVTVLTRLDGIRLFYSLAPWLRQRELACRLDIVESHDYCLTRDRNEHLVFLSAFHMPHMLNRGERVDPRLLERFRERYRTITWFDDGDGGGGTRFEVLPYVDLYVKKQIYRDLSVYHRRLYAMQLYSDWFHNTEGVVDEAPRSRVPLPEDADTSKLVLGWNLGMGTFPVRRRRFRVGVALARAGFPRLGFALRGRGWSDRVNEGRYPVHARFSTRHDSVGRIRQVMLERIGDDPRFLTGKVPPKRYRRELAHSRITLSPFGRGEICYRDFEAIQVWSMLLKPDMSHLHTWPDVFRPGETYAPVAWDGSDLAEQAGTYLEDEDARRTIVSNARDVLADARRALPERARHLFVRACGEA